MGYGGWVQSHLYRIVAMWEERNSPGTRGALSKPQDSATKMWLHNFPGDKLIDPESFFPFLLCYLTILFLILTPWKYFMILLSTFYLALAWKGNAIAQMPRDIANNGNPSPKWQICHDGGDSVVFPVTNLPWFPVPQFPWNKLSPLCTVLDNVTLGVHFPVSDSLPVIPNCVQKDGHKARITGINMPVWSINPQILLTSMADAFSALRHRLNWELSEGVHHSKLASYGRLLLSRVGVSANEVMIWNLSSTVKSIAGSPANIMVAQQKSLDCLDRLFFVCLFCFCNIFIGV